MVEGLLDRLKEASFYEHCSYGKQSHVSFSFGATRAEEILELMHSDVFGPISTPSLRGS